MRRIWSLCFHLSKCKVSSPVLADVVVVVIPVVVSFAREPDLFVLAVAALVAVVFLDVLVIVLSVASFSELLVAVSWAIAVLISIGLFQIDAVLSLSPFLSQSQSQSPARFL